MCSMDYSGNLHRYREYVDALEEERRKIHVFRRELPLCFHLVSQAIDVCRRQMFGSSMENVGVAESECSEQTTSDCPLLEQFIPVKGSSSVCDEGEEAEERTSASNIDEKPSTKLDWLRSVRLWNQNSDPCTTDEEEGKNSACDRGGSKQWEREKCTSTAVESCSTGGEEHGNVSLGGRGKGEKGEESVPRKARRCWSPELHRCFLNALQQLGGAHVATPKQIREVMKVEGLTNDEVKSHLQKFRLHARKPSSPPVSGTNGNGQSTAQFVLVGGMWSSHNEPDEASAEGICKEEIISNGVHKSFPNPKPFSSILNNTPLHKFDHHKHNSDSPKTIKCTTTSSGSPSIPIMTSSHLVL